MTSIRDYIDEYDNWARRRDELEADQEAGQQDVEIEIEQSTDRGIDLLDGLMQTLKQQFLRTEVPQDRRQAGDRS